MSSRNWLSLIQDMLNSACTITEYLQGLTFETFCQNKMLVESVLYNYVILGEASKNIPKEIQDRYPKIPWRLMGDMRNVIIHEYFQVQLKLIWQNSQNDIPLLIEQLQHLLKSETGE